MEIALINDIKSGLYVEFNMSEPEAEYQHWDDSSYFLYHSVYGVFINCFDNISKPINYYGPTLLIETDLKELKVQLEENNIKLNKISSISQFLDYLDRIRLGENFIIDLDEEHPDWKNSFEDILDSLRLINTQLLLIIAKCINEKRVLWILDI